MGPWLFDLGIPDSQIIVQNRDSSLSRTILAGCDLKQSAGIVLIPDPISESLILISSDREDSYRSIVSLARGSNTSFSARSKRTQRLDPLADDPHIEMGSCHRGVRFDLGEVLRFPAACWLRGTFSG